MGLHKSKLDNAENCPIRDVIDRISDRWSTLVMLELCAGELRFSALARQIPDISDRMLAKTLRCLEEDGLVRRSEHAQAPARVDYALTPMGQSLLGPFEALVAWANSNHNAIRASRKAYAAAEKIKLAG